MLDYAAEGFTMPGSDETRIIRFGVFEVDLQTGELRRNGFQIRLQEQPFQVLATLLQRHGELVTRDELRRALWPADTFVDFDHSLNAAIKRLRDALGESADAPVFIETMARRGYRFVAPLQAPHDSKGTGFFIDAEGQRTPQSARTLTARRLQWRMMSAAAVAAVVALAAGGYFYFPRPAKLTTRDTIVLTDFVNTTGNSVFDETLKQGLRVQLEQSPFLNILSEQKVDEQLKLMGSSAGARLTPSLAR